MDAVGEVLVDMANELSGSRIMVADIEGLDDDDSVGQVMARIKLALALKRRPVLQLRSIVEEWDAARIVREVY